MTLGQLKKWIAEAEAEGANDHTEVLVATQPHYPLQSRVSGVKVINTKDEDLEEARAAFRDMTHSDEDREAILEEIERLEQANETVVYILEGSQCEMPYASKSLWD